MCLEELYKQYGELLIMLEFTQAKVNNVKQQIVNELNKATQVATTGQVTEEPTS